MAISDTVNPAAKPPEPDDDTAVLTVDPATHSQQFVKDLVDHIDDEFEIGREYDSEYIQAFVVSGGEER